MFESNMENKTFGIRIELAVWEKMDFKEGNKERVTYAFKIELKEDEELIRVDMEIPNQASDDDFYQVLSHLSFEFESIAESKEKRWLWNETPLKLVYLRDRMTSNHPRLFDKKFPYLGFDAFFSNGLGLPMIFEGSYNFLLHLKKEASWLISDNKCTVKVYLQIRRWNNKDSHKNADKG